MKERTYYTLTIVFTRNFYKGIDDITSMALHKFGCNGVEEFTMDEGEVDGVLGEKAYSGGDIDSETIESIDSYVKNKREIFYQYFFYEDDYKKRCLEFCKYLESSFPGLYFSISEKEWEDWNQEWRKFYSEIVVSPRLRIVPQWKSGDPDKSIFIYPGMGFGTGDHETTFLCLQLFDQFVLDAKEEMRSCLDFGCGSGILGIAARKIGNMEVDFCDIDLSALQNCMQNIELNFPGDSRHANRLIPRSSFVLEKKYNLVFANILENILLSEKNTITESVAIGGYLILSGVLNSQVKCLNEAYLMSGEFEEMQTFSKGDWSATIMKRVK